MSTVTSHGRRRRVTRRGRILGRIALAVIVICVVIIVAVHLGGGSKGSSKGSAAVPASESACWQAIKADGYNGELKAERTPACVKLSTPALSKLLAREDQATNPNG